MSWVSEQVHSALRLPGKKRSSARDQVLERGVWEQLIEKALDYHAGGAAQRLHLAAELKRRLGTEKDPRSAGGIWKDDFSAKALEALETDSGEVIRFGDIEQVTVPLVKSVCQDLAATYSADDLERIYRVPDIEAPDKDTAKTIEWYHDEGELGAKLLEIDELVVLVRCPLLYVRWCEALQCISYEVLPPHWVHVLEHDRWTIDVRLAYAVAIAEGNYELDDGQPGDAIWCAYVRPPLPGDPPGAITRRHPQGRTVRYRRNGGPWPIPGEGDAEIIDGGDGINSLVEAGGWDPKNRRYLWNPLVWHRATPAVESIFPAPADGLVQANLELDITLTMLSYVTNTQTHGQLVLTGSVSVPSALGPLTPIVIDDPNGRAEYISPGANIRAHAEVAQKMMQLQCMLRSLAPDTYSLDRPSIQTGPAKRLEQSKLIDARWRRISMADQWEAARFAIERCWHNKYGVKPERPHIHWDAKQVVRWGELRVPVDRGEQIARIIQEMSAGITSRVDATMESLGLNREDAIQHLTQVDDAGQVVPTPSDGAPSGSGEVPPDPGLEGDAIGDEYDDVMDESEAAGVALERDMKALEQLVKSKAPQEMSRALCKRIAEQLGITDAAVITAIGQNEFRWYTEVQAEITSGNEADAEQI